MENVAFFIRDMGDVDREAQKVIMGMLRSKGLSEGRNLFVCQTRWDKLYETPEYKDFIKRASKDVRICCVGGADNEPFPADPSLVHVKQVYYDTPDERTHATQSSLVEEVARLLNVNLSYEGQLVSAYEKGRIPAMKAFVESHPNTPSGSDPSYTMDRVLEKIYASAGFDNKVQRAADLAISTAQKYPFGLTVITIKYRHSENDCESHDYDRLLIDKAIMKFGKLENFVLTEVEIDDEWRAMNALSVTYYGDKATAEYLKKEFARDSNPYLTSTGKTYNGWMWSRGCHYIGDDPDSVVRSIAQFQTKHICLPFYNAFNDMTLVEVPVKELSDIDHVDIKNTENAESGSIYLKNGECISFQTRETRKLKNPSVTEYRVHGDLLETYLSNFAVPDLPMWSDTMAYARCRKIDEWTQERFGKSAYKHEKPNIFDEEEDRYYDELISCARKMSSKNRDALLQTAKRLSSEHEHSDSHEHAFSFSGRTRADS